MQMQRLFNLCVPNIRRYREGPTDRDGDGEEEIAGILHGPATCIDLVCHVSSTGTFLDTILGGEERGIVCVCVSMSF